jgi:hypothetical protein
MGHRQGFWSKTHGSLKQTVSLCSSHVAFTKPQLGERPNRAVTSRVRSLRHCQLVAGGGTGVPSSSSSMRCSKTCNVMEAQFVGCVTAMRSSPRGPGICAPTRLMAYPSVQSVQMTLPTERLYMAAPLCLRV